MYTKMGSGMLIDNVNLVDIPEGCLKKMFQYWSSKKGDRLMPSRSDLKPEEFHRLLPQVVLVDVEMDPVRYRARLVGTKVVEAIGQDFTGLYFDRFPDIGFLVDRFNSLVRTRRPYLVNDNVQWPEKSFLEYYGLALPLSDNGRDVNIILLGMYYPIQDHKGSESLTARG